MKKHDLFVHKENVVEIIKVGKKFIVVRMFGGETLTIRRDFFETNYRNVYATIEVQQ